MYSNKKNNKTTVFLCNVLSCPVESTERKDERRGEEPVRVVNGHPQNSLTLKYPFINIKVKEMNQIFGDTWRQGASTVKFLIINTKIR